MLIPAPFAIEFFRVPPFYVQPNSPIVIAKGIGRWGTKPVRLYDEIKVDCCCYFAFAFCLFAVEFVCRTERFRTSFYTPRLFHQLNPITSEDITSFICNRYWWL
jgi:hypothetical protein